MSEPKTLFIEHEGVRMRAITLGQGEPVMLVHGMPVSLEVWGATLAPLASEFQVVAMDLPGFGQSSKIALERLEDFAGWLVRLMDELELPSMHLVGHSFGGLVSLGFAQEYPERVRSLVLADAVGLGPYTGEEFQQRIVSARTHEEVRGALEWNFHDPGKLPDAAVGPRLQYLNEPGVRELLGKLFQYRQGWEDQVRSRLNDLKMPLLAMWGKQDRSVPYTNADALKHLPNAQFWLLDDCGHAPQVEASEAFNKRLLDFLRKP